MDRSLYSLILTDDVVREVDRLASSLNTNRSNLVNQILAEYVSYVTPEKRISDIFDRVRELLEGDGSLTPYVEPGQLTMSLKSSLEYKYRPTIKYAMQLYRVPNGAIGELTVAFRTQSRELLAAMAEFFRLWTRLESAYIAQHYPENAIRYGLYDGKFVRSIALPRDRDYTGAELGEAISDYVRMLDELLKGYVSGKYSARELEARYVMYLKRGTGLI